MAQLNLFIDISRNQLLASTVSSQNVDINSLAWFFGDTPTFNIYLLTPNGGSPSAPQFANVLPTGLALFLYLDDGTISGTIYTQQITWTPVITTTPVNGVQTPSGGYFTANLALNTSALQTLIGGGTSGSCWIKIGYVQNGLPTTILSKQVTINVGLPSPAVIPTPAGQTAISAEVAAQTFVPLIGPAGGTFQMTSANGVVFVVGVIDNGDGTGSFGLSRLQ